MVRTRVQLVERLPECCLPVFYLADLRLREEWRKMVGPLSPQSKMASLTGLGQRNKFFLLSSIIYISPLAVPVFLPDITMRESVRIKIKIKNRISYLTVLFNLFPPLCEMQNKT